MFCQQEERGEHLHLQQQERGEEEPRWRVEQERGEEGWVGDQAGHTRCTETMTLIKLNWLF